MNDPCGTVYIPDTGEYVLFYQWGPKSGETAWGTVRSEDLVHWTDAPQAIWNGSHGSKWDSRGVFTGSVFSSLNREGNRILSLYYTSVNVSNATTGMLVLDHLP